MQVRRAPAPTLKLLHAELFGNSFSTLRPIRTAGRRHMTHLLRNFFFFLPPPAPLRTVSVLPGA